MCQEIERTSDKPNLEAGQGEDPLIAGDALYIEPEGKPERASKDDFMHLYDLGHELDDPESDEVQHEYDDLDPNYWYEDRNNLNLTEDRISTVGGWIREMQRLHPCQKPNEDENETDNLTKD